MINNVTNIDELITERNKLKMQLAIAKENFLDEVHALEQHLTPSSIVIDVAKKVFSPPNSVAGHLITKVIGNIASKTLFGGVSWPLRFLLRAGTRNLASHLLVKNVPTIIEKVTNMIAGKKKKPVLSKHPVSEIYK